MYPAFNSRLEIQFSVHECAQFTHNYRASHEDAIIKICRYLKYTWKRGLIISPTRELHVNCYVDSYFGGLLSYEDPQYPVCARSWSGYVVTFSNCPILWVSKLQIDISLSTIHAECMALSQSLRGFLQFKTPAKETLKGLGINTNKLKVVTQSSVFEENSGDIVLASSPRLNPTSKFICVQYQWFRSHIDSDKNFSKPIPINKIDGKVNPADIFTKINSKESEFLALRKLLCGW